MSPQHRGTVWCYVSQLLLFLRSLPDEERGGGGAQSVELINCNSALTHTEAGRAGGRGREGGSRRRIIDATAAAAAGVTTDDAPVENVTKGKEERTNEGTNAKATEFRQQRRFHSFLHPSFPSFLPFFRVRSLPRTSRYPSSPPPLNCFRRARQVKSNARRT